MILLQFNEQSFPSLNSKEDHGEWEAWEDPDPPKAPTAKAAPPPPATAAPPPAYRESKRLAPAPQTSDSGRSLYASGNRRMVPQYTPYVLKPARAAPHVESPQTNGSGAHACLQLPPAAERSYFAAGKLSLGIKYIASLDYQACLSCTGIQIWASSVWSENATEILVDNGPDQVQVFCLS